MIAKFTFTALVTKVTTGPHTVFIQYIHPKDSKQSTIKETVLEAFFQKKTIILSESKKYSI